VNFEILEVVLESILLTEEQTSFQSQNVNEKNAGELSQSSVLCLKLICCQNASKGDLLYHERSDVDG
jgi:hypothetical protein